MCKKRCDRLTTILFLLLMMTVALPCGNVAGEDSAADTFSLDDIEKKAQTEWEAKMKNMAASLEKVEEFMRKDVDPELKIEACQRFLDVYSDKNPYSNEDTRMRVGIQQQLKYWQRQKASAEPDASECTGSTVEVQDCLEKKLTKTDAKLNETYRKLLSMKKSLDEQLNKEGLPGGASAFSAHALMSAQKAWIKYKDANCQFYYSLSYPGTGAGLEYGTCVVRMTKERTHELEKQIDRHIRMTN